MDLATAMLCLIVLETGLNWAVHGYNLYRIHFTNIPEEQRSEQIEKIEHEIEEEIKDTRSVLLLTHKF